MTSIFVFYIVCSWALHVLFLITQNDSSVLLLPCSSWGGQAVADAMVPDVEFSVVKIAACNLSSAGAPSTLSPGIRALQTITPKMNSSMRLRRSSLGDKAPTSENWVSGVGALSKGTNLLHVCENKFTDLQKNVLLLSSHQNQRKVSSWSDSKAFDALFANLCSSLEIIAYSSTPFAWKLTSKAQNLGGIAPSG